MTQPNFTRKEIVDELRRELEMRMKLYPRWVNAGNLTSEQAARQIALMSAAIDLFDQEPKQLDLLEGSDVK